MMTEARGRITRLFWLAVHTSVRSEQAFSWSYTMGNTRPSSDWPFNRGAGHRAAGWAGMEDQWERCGAAFESEAYPRAPGRGSESGLGAPVAYLVTASSCGVAAGYSPPPVPWSPFRCFIVSRCAVAIQRRSLLSLQVSFHHRLPRTLSPMWPLRS